MPNEFCPQCGTARDGASRSCRQCGLDFEQIDAMAASLSEDADNVPAVTPAASTPRASSFIVAPGPQPPATGYDAAVETVKPRIRTSVPGFVARQLKTNEQILGAFPASLWDHRRKGEWRRDKFVLTTERIISYRTGLVHKEMGEMSYRGVTEVQYNRGLRHGKVVIEAANAGLTIEGISNDDAAFCEHVISALVAGRRLAPAR